MVGLLPLCAVTAIDKWQSERVHGLVQIMVERTRRMRSKLEIMLEFTATVQVPDADVTDGRASRGSVSSRSEEPLGARR